MKSLILSIILLAASAFAETPGQVVYQSSEAALIGSVVADVAAKWSRVVPVTSPAPSWLTLPQNQQVGLELGLLVRKPNTSRIVGESLGTAGALVAEHFIVKKWPRTRRVFSVVNFGGAAAAFSAAQ